MREQRRRWMILRNGLKPILKQPGIWKKRRSADAATAEHLQNGRSREQQLILSLPLNMRQSSEKSNARITNGRRDCELSCGHRLKLIPLQPKNLPPSGQSRSKQQPGADESSTKQPSPIRQPQPNVRSILLTEEITTQRINHQHNRQYNQTAKGEWLWKPV